MRYLTHFQRRPCYIVAVIDYPSSGFLLDAFCEPPMQQICDTPLPTF
jgi:hypothetical protein